MFCRSQWCWPTEEDLDKEKDELSWTTTQWLLLFNVKFDCDGGLCFPLSCSSLLLGRLGDQLFMRTTTCKRSTRTASMTMSATSLALCLLLAGPVALQEFRPGNNVLGCVENDNSAALWHYHWHCHWIFLKAGSLLNIMTLSLPLNISKSRFIVKHYDIIIDIAIEYF